LLDGAALKNIAQFTAGKRNVRLRGHLGKRRLVFSQ